jgi:outer membrane receptor protein involved in Fe transport
VLAYQKSTAHTDYQISFFARYSDLHFTPDQLGDLAFNGIASDVTRHSFLSGFQGDEAWRVSPDHTLRAGFVASGEQTYVANGAVVFEDAPGSAPACGTPIVISGSLTCSIADRQSKLGGLLGTYLQDEWRLTDKLTLNAGIRFDQMFQFVDANQLSPRVALDYKPFDGTVIHAGYARYFEPPSQAVGSPANFLLFQSTTAAADPRVLAATKIEPVKPER